MANCFGTCWIPPALQPEHPECVIVLWIYKQAFAQLLWISKQPPSGLTFRQRSVYEPVKFQREGHARTHGARWKLGQTSSSAVCQWDSRSILFISRINFMTFSSGHYCLKAVATLSAYFCTKSCCCSNSKFFFLSVLKIHVWVSDWKILNAVVQSVPGTDQCLPLPCNLFSVICFVCWNAQNTHSAWHLKSVKQCRTEWQQGEWRLGKAYCISPSPASFWEARLLRDGCRWLRLALKHAGKDYTFKSSKTRCICIRHVLNNFSHQHIPTAVCLQVLKWG